MKLDYSPGACSVSPHICLREAGLACTPVMASTKTKKLADGSDYLTIDPKGQVPLLELADGQRLSEGPAFEGGHLRARHHASRLLDRIRRGLLEVGSPINAREADWVVGRLAEVLAWPWLNTAEKPPADA